MILDLLHTFRFLALLGFGLLLPGWLLGRVLGTSGGLAGSLLGSAALLTQLVLLLDACGVPLDLARLSLALAVLGGALAVLALRRKRAAASTAPVASPAPRRWPAWSWLLLPGAIGLLAIAVRAGFEPLAGWDCPFRWDFLAREIIRTGTLHFYPPITSADFLHYGWCDGIAPMVSDLYAWSYLSLGHMELWATTPVVLAQAVAIFWVVGRLAALRGGPVAGALATALLAISPGFLWGTAMGQENGTMALSAVALFWFIEQGRSSQLTGWMAWAGIAAGTGALAREYGFLLVLAGALALAWWRVPRRGWLAFAVAAAAVALPWYLRNWIKTGHPLYCYDLGTLFPTNPVLMEFMRGVIATNGILAHPAALTSLLLTPLALLAGLTLALGLVIGVARWRSSGPWTATLLAFLGFWLWSVAQTAGGQVYSMRVLTPAIALGAVLGGVGLARFATGRRAWIIGTLLLLGALDAGERSLFLPVETQPAWWSESFFAWREFGESAARWRARSDWAAIATAAEGRLVLVSDPTVHAVLVAHGAHARPWFTPDARFLFAPGIGLEEGTARLRAAGYRFILVTRRNSYLDLQLRAHPFFRQLAATTPVLATKLIALYDLYPPAQRRPDPTPHGP